MRKEMSLQQISNQSALSLASVMITCWAKVVGLCDRVAVLDHGEKIADDKPDAIIANPAVSEAYIGKEEDAEVEVGLLAGD
ncbi:hypothetical protein [Brevibacillus nitrificans]|uniref:ABC transporter ATP-binding protein C-terminal domain-containing protein n=1 Tax=Brevibacillus nitrificans TaxID=651560 RepID=UPI00285F76F6|nr:hypothetical protein [Brevibacillus nitrificans]MDR7317324.1 ABC-type branched-subunit amino acid transport system ATPase component [Brevibacillus nitrificans]